MATQEQENVQQCKCINWTIFYADGNFGIKLQFSVSDLQLFGTVTYYSLNTNIPWQTHRKEHFKVGQSHLLLIPASDGEDRFVGP